MSIFLLLLSLSDEIEKMMNSFWWGCNKGEAKGSHWSSWDRLFMHKNDGGIGVKKIKRLQLCYAWQTSLEVYDKSR